MTEAEHEPDRKHDRRHPVRRRQAEEGGSSGGRWTKSAVRRRSRERAAERLPSSTSARTTPRPPDAPTGTCWRTTIGTSGRTILWACSPHGNSTRTTPIGRSKKHFGIDSLYILSAGWGLVKAEYILPKYDITFSASAKGENAYKRRRGDCGYCDFAMLPATTSKHVVFLGGKDYVPLFRRLTDGVARRTVVFNAHTPPPPAPPPHAPGCKLRPYRPRWHYECAKKLVSGEFTVR